MTDFLKLATDAYEASTAYVDANYRKQWEANIRAFQSKHPNGSKYLSDAFKNRSRGFRPKTRSIIRKNEAAAATALFSNMDVVAVDPVDQDNPMAAAGAAVAKELLQYRLTKTIPWFKVVMGALQDAQTLGVVCSYQYWKYQSKPGKKEIAGAIDEQGEQAYDESPQIIIDEPCIELRPLENIRIDPAADWLDPVNSSPYLIDIIPMYVLDVKAMSKKQDKTGEPVWLAAEDSDLRASMTDPDSTRLQRENNRQDRYDDEVPVTDFETVWVHRNFIRTEGGEFVYYTLGTHKLLSKPKRIEEVYEHLSGKRPYVMGICVIESHRPMPFGVADLAQPLQAEANEIANERRDNVKLVLNKKHIVARGKQVDIDALVRNVPGGVVLANDVNLDIKEMSYPDVTTSAYAEQDRINVDLDELVGNFSGGSVQTNRALNETVGGMKLLNQSASMMTEYLLRTFIETWAEPVLRQLMILEQEYENDQTVLALAGKKAQLFHKFGISQVSDFILEQDLELTINVGMGATNPDERLRKFLAATESAIKLTAEGPPGMNSGEIVKEIYAFAGFRDGERFFPGKVDPQLQKAQAMIQQLQGLVKGKQMEIQAGLQETQMKLQSQEKIAQAQLHVDAARIDGDLKLRQAELMKPDGQQGTDPLELAEAQWKAKHEEEKLAFDKWKAQLEADKAIIVAEIGAKTQLKTASMSANASLAGTGKKVSDDGEVSVDPKLDEVIAEINKNMQQITVTQGEVVTSLTKKVEELSRKPKVGKLKIIRGPDGRVAALDAS